jgi:hypothetical protein
MLIINRDTTSNVAISMQRLIMAIRPSIWGPSFGQIDVVHDDFVRSFLGDSGKMVQEIRNPEIFQ